MQRRSALAVICAALLMIWSCSGSAPTDEQNRDETPTAARDEGGQVFEDGFEEGDTEQWNQDEETVAEEQKDTQSESPPAQPSSQPPSS